MSRMYTIAFGLVLSTGVAGAAAAQSVFPPTSAPAQDSLKGSHGHRGGPHGMMGRRLFQGIQFTDAQRAQLKGIHEKYLSQEKTIHEAMRPAFEEARAARQRGDTAAARSAWEGTANERTKLRALHEQQLAEVRSLLTPEQLQRFDQNKAALDAKMQRYRGSRGTA